ncbi:hypothetical protein [Polaromonas sp.]|uniref:hypothetical protein n=1 Tax=Polaromonas sp. TaxID=1869339 RepID=UPI0037539AEF
MVDTMQPRCQPARYWMTRLYLATNVLALALAAVFDSSTLAHRVLIESGAAGMWAMQALAVVAVVGLADCLVNDLLPDRFILRWSFRHRHLVYMALALGLVSISYITAKNYGPSTVHVFYMLHAAFATFVAFFDLFARHGKQ